MTILEELLALYARAGASNYLGEALTQLEHAQQTAHFAKQAGAPDALVVAALLHDVGHLLEDVPDDLSTWTTDARHEETGSRWLAQRFAPEVSEPVRLHVPAKRYLCATDVHYFRQLSDASVTTLRLQGGPMTAAEVAAFEREAFWRDAVLLRRCDDQGKVAGLSTPRFADYATILVREARDTRASAPGH